MAICLVVAQSRNPSRLRTPAFGRKVLVSEKLTIEAALRREARWCVCLHLHYQRAQVSGPDASRWVLPALPARQRLIRLYREPDFSPGRGNLPTLEYLTTSSAPPKGTAPEAVKLRNGRKPKRRSSLE